MTKAKRNSVIAALLSLTMVFTLVLGVLPNEAHAVTQAEIDALQEQKDALTAQRQEKQDIVDELESQHATVLEQKLAMDARNKFTQQQIDLTNNQIELYGQMIEDKKLEVEAAKQREEEQLQRYRERVCAMEEDGGMNYLAIILRANSFGQLLTLMDDIGEIMESDRNLEDAYIAAREETERVQAEYEQTKSELEAKQEELRTEQEELQAQIDEATALIADLENDMENRKAEYEQLREAENEASAEIEQMIAELERQKEEERRQQEENLAVVNEAADPAGSRILLPPSSPAADSGACMPQPFQFFPAQRCMLVHMKHGAFRQKLRIIVKSIPAQAEQPFFRMHPAVPGFINPLAEPDVQQNRQDSHA